MAKDAPLSHADEKEHRRLIALRANQALPVSGGTMTGPLVVQDPSGASRPVGVVNSPRVDVSTSRTLVASDWTRTLRKSAAGALTLTIPNHAGDGVHNEITIRLLNGINTASSAWTIAAAGGVSLRWYNGSGSVVDGTPRTLAGGGWAELYKQADNVYLIWGIGLS